MFVIYCKQSKTYRLLYIASNQVSVSRDVIVEESSRILQSKSDLKTDDIGCLDGEKLVPYLSRKY
jgi:hypothetical protein